jgi:CRP/FNR family transcriptional regulator, cyclic AMP receptor protein
MERLEYPAGAVIFMVGDPAVKSFLIHSGKIELRRGTGDANDLATHLGPDEVFGEMSLIDERTHSTSARAVTKVHLTAISRDEFEQILTLIPQNYRVHLDVLFGRLRALSSQTVSAPVIVAPKPKTIYVTIHPLTRLAASMLPRDGIWIQKFPFRIGRSAKEFEANPPEANDLCLNDRSPYNVSRNHAIIEIEDGEVILKDRGSSLGTVVNEHQIGGNSYDHEIPLDEGDNTVILGGFMSKFQFRINIQIA